jgi:hypothetical protein
VPFNGVCRRAIGETVPSDSFRVLLKAERKSRAGLEDARGTLTSCRDIFITASVVCVLNVLEIRSTSVVHDVNVLHKINLAHRDVRSARPTARRK